MRLAHGRPRRWRLVFWSGHLTHYRAGLFRKIHRGADENYGFDTIRFHRRHMEKNVSSHAQSDGAALANSEMVEESEGVERALPMCNGSLRIVRSTVTASIGLDHGIFMRESLCTGMNPVFVTSGAAMQKQ